MQRADLWDQAQAKAITLIDEIGTQDELAIVGFDKEPRTLLSFEQTGDLTPEQIRVAATAADQRREPHVVCNRDGTSTYLRCRSVHHP